MTLTSYPFEAQDVTETQFSYMFKELQDSGVVGVPGDTKFAVTTDGSGMDVQIAAGFAFVRGHVVDSTSSETRTLAASEANPRIDRVVLRLDPTANTINIVVLKGTAATSPVAPALTQTTTGIYDVPLARIAVPANALNIVTADITDERLFTSGRVGVWTTATRPPGVRGRFGFNFTTGGFEFWNGSAWTPAAVTDHGALTGLADDDHTQYLNNARHDTTARHGAGVVDHGSIGGLGDNDHPQYALRTGVFGYKETRVNGATSETVTLDLASGNVFEITPTANITIALANASAADRFTPVTIRFNNSTYAVTWPAGTKFNGGAAPKLDGVTWVSGVVDAGGVLTVGAAWTKVA